LRWIYLRQWDRVDSKHYGLGWRIIGYKGRQVAYHGGYVSGYRAELAVCRDEGIGIAFLTNSPGKVGSRVVPDFLDMWFERVDVPEHTGLIEE
jgi:beta-lactamase class C